MVLPSRAGRPRCQLLAGAAMTDFPLPGKADFGNADEEYVADFLELPIDTGRFEAEQQLDEAEK